VGVEGRKPVALDPGPCAEAPCNYNNQMTDIIYAFTVTDEVAEARRLVVDDYKCESCHSNLELHGGGRNNATEYCQTCHRPFATDEEERLPGDPNEESIHFKYMIHKIHRGADLDNGYVVAGHNNSIHDYSDVEFPGDLRNCRTCHADTTDRFGNPVDAFTYVLPLPEGVLPTYSPDTLINPFMPPITSSCLSCHDSDDAAAHADANTSVNLGESCGACHDEGKTFSVTRMHAR
jgi:OmcA/MtrC family decaheme c-type cytochrome